MNNIQKQIDKILVDETDLEISILDDESNVAGLLKPITSRHLECNEIIQKLTVWRNLNMENFLTQFVATPDRTRSWIKNILLKEKGQMLFLIYSQNQVIGHYGFKELTTESVLLDNAMRGEKGGDPKLLVNAGKALLEWLFSRANVAEVRAEVMMENIPSIMLTTRIGFTNRTRHPLKKITINNETKWEIGDEGDISAFDKYCFNYTISKHDFEYNKNTNK